MIKASILALALVAGSANATDNTKTAASVTAQTKLIDHGVEVSNGATVGLDLRFSNVLLDGVFVRTDFDTVSDLSPINNTLSVRSDLGVGFAGTALGNEWEVSLNRTLNPVIYAGDYTELRGRVKRGLLFAEINQGLTSDVNKDTYLAGGIEQAYGPFTVGGQISTVRYSETDSFAFNNTEVFGRYNAWRNVDLNVNYSYGGNDVNGVDVGNQLWGGVTVRF
jgi:hypothetical protein